MNLERALGGKDRLTGLNGVTEHIVEAVITDPRWCVRWMGWDSAGKVREISLAYTDGVNPMPHGFIEIRISESWPDAISD